jgi:hypothetical protein
MSVAVGSTKTLMCPSTHAPKKALSSTGWGTADTAFLGTVSNPYAPSSGAAAATTTPGSYAINGWLSVEHSPVDPMTQNFFKKESDLRSPSMSPLFLDSIWYFIFPLETDPILSPMDLYDGYTGNRTGCRHSMGLSLIDRHSGQAPGSASRAVPHSAGQALPGAIDIVFADNHAEVARLNNMWNYTWHNGWVAPNPHP